MKLTIEGKTYELREDGWYQAGWLNTAKMSTDFSAVLSRLSLAEKVVEAAENVGPVLYAYLNEQDTGDHNVRALMYEVDAALSAYRSAK